MARVDGVLAVNRLALFQKGDNGWRRLAESETLSLKPYQLPELVGVRVESGSGTPGLPGGIGALEGTATVTSLEVPVPIIPDVC